MVQKRTAMHRVEDALEGPPAGWPPEQVEGTGLKVRMTRELERSFYGPNSLRYGLTMREIERLERGVLGGDS